MSALVDGSATTLHWVNGALAVINLAVFSWAIRGYFRPAIDGGSRLNTAIACGVACTVFTPIAFWLWRPSLVTVSAFATVLYPLSLALFAWAAFSNRKQRLALALTREGPTHLSTSGPHRHIRHPFYTSYLLTWMAGVAAIQHPAMLVPVIAMGIVYGIAALDEEKRFLDDTRFSGPYQQYMATTGRFLPKLVSGARR